MKYIDSCLKESLRFCMFMIQTSTQDYYCTHTNHYSLHPRLYQSVPIIGRMLGEDVEVSQTFALKWMTSYFLDWRLHYTSLHKYHTWILPAPQVKHNQEKPPTRPHLLLPLQRPQNFPWPGQVWSREIQPFEPASEQGFILDWWLFSFLRDGMPTPTSHSPLDQGTALDKSKPEQS